MDKLDLFGQVPVVYTNIADWCAVVPVAHYSTQSRQFIKYAVDYNVTDKITRELLQNHKLPEPAHHCDQCRADFIADTYHRINSNKAAIMTFYRQYLAAMSTYTATTRAECTTAQPAPVLTARQKPTTTEKHNCLILPEHRKNQPQKRPPQRRKIPASAAAKATKQENDYSAAHSITKPAPALELDRIAA